MAEFLVLPVMRVLMQVQAYLEEVLQGTLRGQIESPSSDPT